MYGSKEQGGANKLGHTSYIALIPKEFMFNYDSSLIATQNTICHLKHHLCLCVQNYYG